MCTGVLHRAAKATSIISFKTQTLIPPTWKVMLGVSYVKRQVPAATHNEVCRSRLTLPGEGPAFAASLMAGGRRGYICAGLLAAHALPVDPAFPAPDPDLLPALDGIGEEGDIAGVVGKASEDIGA